MSGTAHTATPEPINVAAWLPRVAADDPKALAVAVADGRGGWLRISRGELDQLTDRAAHGLSSLGIGHGTRCVLMVTPGPAFFALTFALFKLGAVPVMVDPGMGVKNLGQCLAEAQPEAFIGVTKAHVARVLLGWGRRTLRTLVTVGPRLLWGGHRYEALVDAAPSTPFPVAPTTSDQTAAILFTSGSTGVPKGAVYTHGIFSSQVRLLRQMYGIEPGEVDLSTFPLFALFGPALGMASVVPEMDASRPAKADPRKLVDAIETFRCTNVFANPALVDKLGRYAEAHPGGFSSVRRVLSAGAPASVPALRRLAAHLPDGAEIHTPYGATESLPVATVGSAFILSESAARTEAGAGVCVGFPVDEMEVRIIGITDDPIAAWSEALCLAPGEVGEIVVKGPVVTVAYFNRDASTALAKIREPDTGAVRHRMGDLGTIDADGRLWMCGRKSHRVQTTPKPLFTIPCEAVFNTHPDVFRTALVGIERTGQVVPVLFVEPEASARGKDRRALERELREIGQRFEHTRTINRFLFSKGFPVDVRHNAKIFREKLAVLADKELP